MANYKMLRDLAIRHAQAVRFFRKVLKRQGRLPRRLITDKLRSYSAAHRTVMPSVPHSTRQYENNRAEVSHQPTRQRERQMRRFKSVGHAQHFLSVHGLVQNLFRTGRHVLLALEVAHPDERVGMRSCCPTRIIVFRPRLLAAWIDWTVVPCRLASAPSVSPLATR